MAEAGDINSILAVDIGSVNTRAVLIDLVDGAYRLVARSVAGTTAGDPLRDVAVGMYRAAQQMAEQIGRPLVAGDMKSILMPEATDGSGVDAVLATASVGRPLRVVLVGLMPDVSVSSGLNVLSGSYVQVVDQLSLADVRTEEQQINAILARQPDLIFIVGGTDAGAEAPILRLVEVVRQAVLMATVERPMVLYAGNRAAQAQVRAALQGVTALYVADNVRPSLLDEQLGSAQQELAAVYDRFKVNNRGGFDEVSAISTLGVLPTAQSYTNIVRYLGEIVTGDGGEPAASVGVLAVDLGSATTTVAASIRRRTTITIRTDIGIGHSAAGALKATRPADVRRWLTWEATDAEILDYAYNKTLRPATVPQTPQELELEYARAREAIRAVVDQARRSWRLRQDERMPALSPLIGAGTLLANTPHAGLAALILLDAIQPVGVTELWIDPAGLIPALGALAYLKPSAVVQMLDAGDLVMIGSVVCPDGRVRIGRGGMKVTLTLESGEVVQHGVVGGSLWTYPLPPGQTAAVEVRLSRGLNIHGRSWVKLTLSGGASGLIFDARGRPLPLPRRAEARAQLYPRWAAGVRGRVQFRVDEVDETAVDAEALSQADSGPEPEAVVPQPRRRGLFGWRRREAATAAPEAAREEALEPEEPDMEAFADLLEAPEAAEEKPRRGLFGRRRRRGKAGEQAAQAETAAEEAAGQVAGGTTEADEMAEMLDELRLPDERPRKRRFFRR